MGSNMLSRDPSVVFALPTLNYSGQTDSVNSSSVYPGLSQAVLGILASPAQLTPGELPDRGVVFRANLSKSGFPNWMWPGDGPWKDQGNVILVAAPIGCSLRVNHTEVNVTRDGLLLSQNLPSSAGTSWMADNTFNWNSTLPTSTIERQFSIAFQSFLSLYGRNPSDYPLNEYADNIWAFAPEAQLWNQLTSGLINPFDPISFNTFESLLANLTASYLYSYRKLCIERSDIYDCGPTANTLHRSNITVYYNGYVASVQVSPWRAITGFVTSLILFLLSLAILGVTPAENNVQGSSKSPCGKLEVRRPNGPLGTGLLDIIRLGSPTVHSALNIENNTQHQAVIGLSSRTVADVRVRCVYTLWSAAFEPQFLTSGYIWFCHSPVH